MKMVRYSELKAASDTIGCITCKQGARSEELEAKACTQALSFLTLYSFDMHLLGLPAHSYQSNGKSLTNRYVISHTFRIENMSFDEYTIVKTPSM